MCGIAGIVSFNQEISADRVRRMTSMMDHRGPDHQGIAEQKNCVLGHRRLAIIDLSEHANQPYLANNKMLVFNGEIYNFLEIRKELLKTGVEFKTNSDTEVILHGFEIWGGEELCKRLKGMFAFAIWDGRSKELFFARDRFGEKPLYFSIEKGRFVLSSVLTTITRTSNSKYELSYNGLQSYLQLGYCLTPFHIFKGVESLPPGHFGTFTEAGLQTHAYWDLHVETPPKKIEDALHKTNQLLRKSIAGQLIADVPVGCLLSGGVDSTLIAAVAAELNQELQLFTVRMPDSPLDESGLAVETAKELGRKHHVIDAKPVSQDDFYELMGQFSEPLGDSSALGVWMVAREAKKMVKVVLTGDGGDEFFEGYNTVALHAGLKEIRNFSLNPLGKFTARAILAGSSPMANVPSIRRFRTYLQLITKSHKDYHLEKSLIPAEFTGFIRTTAREEIMNELDSSMNDIWTSSPIKGDRYQQTYFDIKTDLPGDYIPKVDTSTMFHSLEARAPFLDHEIANFGFNLPLNFKLYRNTPKGMLKELLRSKVSPGLFQKIATGKRGFVLPVNDWFDGKWSDITNDLRRSPLINDGYLDEAILNTIVDRSAQNPRFARIRYSLLALDVWYRQNA